MTGGKCLFIIVSKNSPKRDKAGFREQNVSFIDEGCYLKQQFASNTVGVSAVVSQARPPPGRTAFKLGNFTNSAASVHIVAKVKKCWTMSGRLDKGVNVLNVVMQDGQRSQCVKHCYVKLV